MVREQSVSEYGQRGKHGDEYGGREKERVTVVLRRGPHHRLASRPLVTKAIKQRERGSGEG